MSAKRIAVTAVCLFTLCASLPALAQSSRIYFASYLGLDLSHNRDFSESTKGNSGQIDFNNTPTFAGALGLRFTDNLRLEGELSYSDPSVSHMKFSNSPKTFRSGEDLKTWLLMANLYYDFAFNWHNVQPYVTAGVGVARHSGEIDSGSAALAPDSSGTADTFAWQAGTGLKYRVSPDLALTGGYRFLDTGDPSIGSYKVHSGSHEIRMGLEYDIPVGWLK